MILVSSNLHLTGQEKGREKEKERMDQIVSVLSHRKVFEALRDRNLIWETVCVNDRTNFKPRVIRHPLRSLLEKLSLELLEPNIRLVDFRGRELKAYPKIPSATQFIKDVLDYSEKNDTLFKLQQSSAPRTEPEPAPPQPKAEGEKSGS